MPAGTASSPTPRFDALLMRAADAHDVAPLLGVRGLSFDLDRLCAGEVHLRRALDDAVIDAARHGLRAADIRAGLTEALTPLLRRPLPVCEDMHVEGEEEALAPVCRIAGKMEARNTSLSTRPLCVRALTGELGAMLRTWRSELFLGDRYEQEMFSPRRPGRPPRGHLALRASLQSRDDARRALRAWSRICPDPDPIAGERLTLRASLFEIGHIAHFGAPATLAPLLVSTHMADDTVVCTFCVERRLVVDGRPLHVRAVARLPVIDEHTPPDTAVREVADRIGLSWDGVFGPVRDDITAPELCALADAQAIAADGRWESTTLEALVGPEPPCEHASMRWHISEAGTAAALSCVLCGRERVGAVRREHIPTDAGPLALTQGERFNADTFLAAMRAETGLSSAIPDWRPGCLRSRYWRTPPIAPVPPPRAHTKSTEAQLLARRR